jgi:hypothetical protein
MLPARLVSQQEPRTADVKELPQASERWALLVGVEDYTDQNISPLRGPENDVNKVRETLVKYAAFSDDNIIVLSTASHDGTMPTRDGILVALSKIRKSVPENGLLLFMFSGHGISRGGRAFLLPSNATLTEDADLLEDTSLSVDLLRQRIAATHVKQVIVFLDACRNDPERSKAASDDNPLSEPFTKVLDFARLNKEVQASAVIYATGLGERAYIDTSEGLGYLAEAIIKGMGGEAADPSRQVTLGNLVRYIQSNVPKWVTRDLSKDQKPFSVIAGYEAEQLVVSAIPMPPPSTAAVPTAASVIRTPPPSIIPVPVVMSDIPTTLLLSTVAIRAETTIEKEGIDIDHPIPLQGNLDFVELYKKYQYTDAAALVKLGEAAFVRGNYSQTIGFIEQARWIGGDLLSAVGKYNYPCLAGAYLFLQGDLARFSDILKEMARRMRLVGDLQTVSKAITQLTVLRPLIPNQGQKTLDEVMRTAFSTASPTTVAWTVCYFRGSSLGGTTFRRTEACIIPDVAHLDRNYQQALLVDSYNSPRVGQYVYAHVPPGIEIKASGRLKWLVEEPKLDSNFFKIKNSCVVDNDERLYPGANRYRHSGPGNSCEVSSEIIAHYHY